MDRGGEVGARQGGGSLMSAVIGITPYPTPRVQERGRIAFQFACRDAEKAPRSWKIEPNDNICGMEASVCLRPVVARNDPSIAAYQFSVFR